MEEAAAVLVGCMQRVAGVGGDRVVRGRALAVHRGQASAQRTAALHLHAVRELHLVLDRLLLVHSGGAGGRRRRAGVRGHVFRGGGGEAVEVRVGVGHRERRDRRRAGAAAAGVAGAGGVQTGFAEVADRPGVVVVSRREGSFSGVQPGNTGAVDEVWSANLVPCEAS